MTETVTVSFVFGEAWSIETEVIVGAELATATALDVSGPSDAKPSETETRSAIRSPLSPLPATARSRVAPVAPPRSVPFLRHCRVGVTASPSGSPAVIVAESVSFVVGAAWSIATAVSTGAELATVTAPDVDGAEPAVPSFAVTWTLIASPLSPFPTCARSKVAAVSPKRSTPFLFHW